MTMSFTIDVSGIVDTLRGLPDDAGDGGVHRGVQRRTSGSARPPCDRPLKRERMSNTHDRDQRVTRLMAALAAIWTLGFGLWFALVPGSYAGSAAEACIPEPLREWPPYSPWSSSHSRRSRSARSTFPAPRPLFWRPYGLVEGKKLRPLCR
jgi:hypothetical protein